MIESITVITLLLSTSALNRVDLQAIFDRDGYESRRSALPGARLLKVLVVYQGMSYCSLALGRRYGSRWKQRR